MIHAFWEWLYTTHGFVPAAGCSPGWTPAIIRATALSNLGIAAVYVTIPALLIVGIMRGFYRNRAVVALWFAAFIFLCGMSHAIRAVTLYVPVYHLQIAVNVLAALVSWFTAAVISPGVFGDIVRSHEEREAELAARIEAVQEEIKVREARLDRILDQIAGLPRLSPSRPHAAAQGEPPVRDLEESG